MRKKQYKNPYEYVGFLVWILNNIMSNAISAKYKTSERLSPVHLMVLAALYWRVSCEKDINQKDFAVFTAMKETTISVILRKLHALKLVDLRSDEKDKRAKIVTVTKRGEKVVVDFLDIAVALEKKISGISSESRLSLRNLIRELS